MPPKENAYWSAWQKSDKTTDSGRKSCHHGKQESNYYFLIGHHPLNIYNLFYFVKITILYLITKTIAEKVTNGRSIPEIPLKGSGNPPMLQVFREKRYKYTDYRQ